MVGATTLDEYREHVEKDPALERRFQPVLVGEPSVEDTVGILRGLKERYEVHHGVRITDAALVAAATLSDRYVTARFLPDKAIDLVDEAASRLRMEIDSRPVEIDEVERAVRRMEIEQAALRKETDDPSKDRLARLDRDLAERKEELAGLTARWQREKDAIAAVRELKESIESVRGEAERAERDGELERAAELRYGRLPALERDIAGAQDRLASVQQNGAILKEEVGADDVADVVAAWTGIPAGRLLEGETAKLLRMEDALASRLVGQHDAVRAVSRSEEHTSELQSRQYLVCRLLLEKKTTKATVTVPATDAVEVYFGPTRRQIPARLHTQSGRASNAYLSSHVPEVSRHRLDCTPHTR